MFHDLLDHHRQAESRIHRLDAGLKLAIAVGAAAAMVLIPLPAGWPFLLLAAVLMIATAWLSKLPWLFLARRLIMLEPFVFSVAVLALFQHRGIEVFLAVLARSTLCLFAMILLAATTPFAQICAVLRRSGFPGIMISVIALMYRYLFVLIGEAGRLKRARASRTFVAGRKQTWLSSADIISRLFMRSARRSDRIYSAMCARGWQ
ncbi:MAG: hypothetical protein HY747_12220 [Elusimicrobia bacterium]|nr:hypothetical protein [Elusimicrobiota bacterium]